MCETLVISIYVLFLFLLTPSLLLSFHLTTVSFFFGPLFPFLIFSGAALPHPEVDYAAFEAALEAALAKVKKVYCPISKKERSWVNVAKLRASLGKSGGCSLM